MMRINSTKDLKIYVGEHELALRVFESGKGFPDEERYAPTSQVCQSSRSMCMNLREARARRRYEAHLISKLTDFDGETDSSLDFAKGSGYIPAKQHDEMTPLICEIGRTPGSMTKNLPHS